MKLDELEPSKALEGEVCDSDEFANGEDSETEEDLQEALQLLEDCLLCMEKIVIRPKDRRVRCYPRHMHEVMENVGDYLEQWGLPDREEEERELSVLDR